MKGNEQLTISKAARPGLGALRKYRPTYVHVIMSDGAIMFSQRRGWLHWLIEGSVQGYVHWLRHWEGNVASNIVGGQLSHRGGWWRRLPHRK